jgi:hypothetical protein
MSTLDSPNSQKLAEEHIEDVKATYTIPLETESDVIVDEDARGYVNHHIVIDEATNNRLRWLAHKRYVRTPSLSFMKLAVMADSSL